MADDIDDPREVPWHPRFTRHVLGHDKAFSSFASAFAAGRPHHAWLITGPFGCGKSTLAYHLAKHVLSQSMAAEQVERWVNGRAHPDLAVLERSFNDAKPRKLRGEISVDDARRFIDFFSRTSGSGGWRVGIVDVADDLNTESANALLKLVEEPPNKSLILLVCNNPGRLLRTLRSRCRTLSLTGIPDRDCAGILDGLPADNRPDTAEAADVIAIAGGRPGFAMQLLQSDGAKAFQTFLAAKRLDSVLRNKIAQQFAARTTAPQNFSVFMGLLLDWIASNANSRAVFALAQLHAEVSRQVSVVEAYNLDRRTAVLDVLTQVDLALKAA